MATDRQSVRPTWQKIEMNLSDAIVIEYLVGGLAPDSDIPMPEKTQHLIKGAWGRIHDKLGTEFNFDFWDKNIPRRSTYPACRAVLAAKHQGFEKEMIKAIQHGYYLHALNPSDDHVLIHLAEDLGLDIALFTFDLNSEKTNEELGEQISKSRMLTRRGFPSLVLSCNGSNHFIEHDYEDPDITISKIEDLLR